MGRATRVVFVAIPFLLTLATFASLLLVFTGDINSSTVPRHFHFIFANTTKFRTMADQNSVGTNIADWYTIGIWDYCKGNNGNPTPTFCSDSKAFFWFNPYKIWQIGGSSIGTFAQFQNRAQNDALVVYSKACKGIFVVYIAAVIASGLTVIVSLFAFCSRIGSVFTWIFGVATAILTIGASITATVVYALVVGYLRDNFGDQGLSVDLSTPIFVATWLAAAFILAANLFWAFTACCCSGKVRRNGKGYDRHESWGNGNVPSPFAVASHGPNDGYASAYYNAPYGEKVGDTRV